MGRGVGGGGGGGLHVIIPGLIMKPWADTEVGGVNQGLHLVSPGLRKPCMDGYGGGGGGRRG